MDPILHVFFGTLLPPLLPVFVLALPDYWLRDAPLINPGSACVFPNPSPVSARSFGLCSIPKFQNRQSNFPAFSMQERAQKLAARAASGGKLASQLETQKKQTRNELLAAGSEEERRARAIDEIAETARHD